MKTDDSLITEDSELCIFLAPNYYIQQQQNYFQILISNLTLALPASCLQLVFSLRILPEWSRMLEESTTLTHYAPRGGLDTGLVDTG